MLIIRLEKVPKSLHTIAKELFKIVVCLKPRMIQRGLQQLLPQDNPNEIISDNLINSIPQYNSGK